MGIVSFFKEAGEKLFGSKDTEAAAAAAAQAPSQADLQERARAANDAAAKAIEKYIAAQSLTADGLALDAVEVPIGVAEVDAALQRLDLADRELGLLERQARDRGRVALGGRRATPRVGRTSRERSDQREAESESERAHDDPSFERVPAL